MAVRFADLRPPERLRSAGSLDTVGLAAAGAAAVSVAFAASPRQIANGPVVCPFRLATGLPCPGCGLTRSWVYIAHGDFGDALRANPFGYLTLAAALVLIAIVLASMARGRPIPSMSRAVRSRPFLLTLAGWLAFAAVRIAVVATG